MLQALAKKVKPNLFSSMASTAGTKPAPEMSDQVDISPTIAVEIIRCLGHQREKNEFCDVTVAVEDMEFKCHRVILAACSGFFNDLIASKIKEAKEGKVCIKGISKETFAQVLDCIYTGKNVLTESNIFAVWHAANNLHIIFMLRECEKYLMNTLSPDNCLAVYKQSKLLDAKTVTLFSWDYILKHFDLVASSDDLLTLTAKEMMTLVASPHLVTASEDRVLQTILNWIEYDPEKENEQVSKENMKTKTKKPESEMRVQYLADLLKSSRICLVSGRCLMNTVWTNIRIQADPNALGIVQEAIEYQLEIDRRHDYCPPTAIHRPTSKMETVVVALNTFYPARDTLICKRQDDQWYVLDTSYNENITAACFDQNIFIANDEQQIHMYMIGSSTYKDLPSLSISAGIQYLFSLGNFLYAVHENNRHSIEALNIQDMLAGQDDCQWVQVGALSNYVQSISCTTVVGDKLLFLGNQAGKDDTVVECFDTSTLTSYPLDSIPGTSEGMITFRKGKDAFALQGNGALSRITTCSMLPFVSISHETSLWDFDRDLKGAVLFNDELQLFDQNFPTKEADKVWELGVPGVFKRVRNLNFTADYKCFMITNIPKRSLPKKGMAAFKP